MLRYFLKNRYWCGFACHQHCQCIRQGAIWWQFQHLTAFIMLPFHDFNEQRFKNVEGSRGETVAKLSDTFAHSMRFEVRSDSYCVWACDDSFCHLNSYDRWSCIGNETSVFTCRLFASALALKAVCRLDFTRSPEFSSLGYEITWRKSETTNTQVASTLFDVLCSADWGHNAKRKLQCLKWTSERVKLSKPTRQALHVAVAYANAVSSTRFWLQFVTSTASCLIRLSLSLSTQVLLLTFNRFAYRKTLRCVVYGTFSSSFVHLGSVTNCQL